MTMERAGRIYERVQMMGLNMAYILLDLPARLDRPAARAYMIRILEEAIDRIDEIRLLLKEQQLEDEAGDVTEVNPVDVGPCGARERGPIL